MAVFNHCLSLIPYSPAISTAGLLARRRGMQAES